MLKVAHILRKYQPQDWGGTETAVLRLLQGLNEHAVGSVVLAPKTAEASDHDPISETAAALKRFKAFVPCLGISRESREQLIAWGGNLFSFELLRVLMKEKFDVIHSHALNRLAGIGMMVAHARKLPFVTTIHGGVMDLPAQTHDQLTAPLKGALEWGKALGWMVQSRHVLEKADAVFTCNPKEAELLSKKYPKQRVVVQPHSVNATQYAVDHREAALLAYPQIAGRDVLLSIARIDPVKNQLWLANELPQMVRDHPKLLLVLAGSVTCQETNASLLRTIEANGLSNHVLLTGGLKPGSPELIGLLQSARAMVLPSVSETFGIVILEAWATRTPVISSRTSGAASLVKHGENGMLFDLDQPTGFHSSLKSVLTDKPLSDAMTGAGLDLVKNTYDVAAVASNVKKLYDGLIEARRRAA